MAVISCFTLPLVMGVVLKEIVLRCQSIPILDLCQGVL